MCFGIIYIFSFLPYFDHDAFMHHAIRILDASDKIASPYFLFYFTDVHVCLAVFFIRQELSKCLSVKYQISTWLNMRTYMYTVWLVIVISIFGQGRQHVICDPLKRMQWFRNMQISVCANADYH